MKINLNSNIDKKPQQKIITEPDYVNRNDFGRQVRNSTALPNLAYGGKGGNNVSLPMINKGQHPTRNSIDVFDGPQTKTFAPENNQAMNNNYLVKNR